MKLQQGTSLWGTPYFGLAYVVDKKLMMKHFEAWLNPNFKGKMSVHRYTYYEDMYETVVNDERAIKEKNEFYNKQSGKKRKKDQYVGRLQIP